ncbi:MAG: Crp/Fnr family transcriptional regulator, partial [Bacteroidales bacterium]|nr:Crp/Fnr family transcriptional regulator [Bacteroidales bacterium]
KLNTCETCFVKNDLFRKITKDEIDILSYIKNCNTYDKGDIIYGAGSRISGVYCLNSGIVKHYKTGNDGKEQIIRFSKAGELFGYRSILSNEAACTTAKVVEESSVCIIPAAHFITLINTNSNFAMSIIKLSCKELGDANQNILDIAQKNVRERLAEILLLLHENFGINKDGDLNIFLTREELAGLVGTATESVIRLLSEFKKTGLIELNKRKIKLLDLNKLKHISQSF